MNSIKEAQSVMVARTFKSREVKSKCQTVQLTPSEIVARPVIPEFSEKPRGALRRAGGVPDWVNLCDFFVS